MYKLYPEIKPNATFTLATDPPHQLYVEECGNETGLPVVIADDPLSCVVLGSGKVLDELDLLKQVTVSS